MRKDIMVILRMLLLRKARCISNNANVNFYPSLTSCTSRIVGTCAKRLAKIYLQTHLIVPVATCNGKMLAA